MTVEPPQAAQRAVGEGSPAFSTFLLTDIEGSTRLWEEHADAMGAALATHDRILRRAIESNGGSVVKTLGDGMLAVFQDPMGAIDSAVNAQRALGEVAWPSTGPLRVRMAVHSGSAESRDGDYFGQAINRDARILAIGHGGQILLSAVAAVLARDGLPKDMELLDLGQHRLRDLDRAEQVFQLGVADLPRDFPPLRSLSTRRSNLPVALTSFIGRERERRGVEALLQRARLVTLIGTGGTGKTRLMLEVAGAVAARFADGVWLAELGPLSDPSQIAPEIARALGAPDTPGVPAIATVSEYLASKDLLLLLDNAEHLIDGVAEVTGQMLARAPGVRILATSREALAVSGEAVFQVPSLSCPGVPSAAGQGPAGPIDMESARSTEAVQLFATRAGAALPSFELTGANIAAVGEICRRLDGIPLAIELAAARVSAMSPVDIAQGLGDRFRLLSGGRRTAVPRQQTLHALIDWSWDLLTEDDRRVLRRVSIFAGGWTPDAAARVVSDPPAGSSGAEPGASVRADLAATLDGLARLVDRSLVILDREPSTRYRMLETIRQYAREQLIQSGELPAIAGSHLAEYAALARVAAPQLHGPEMVDWLDRLDAEAENLGAALEWALESAPDQAIQMAIAMLDYWRFRVASPDSEARILAAIELVRKVVAPPGEPSIDDRRSAALLLGQAATIWGTSGRPELAMVWGGEALVQARLAGDPSALVVAIMGHAIATVFSRGGEDLVALFQESVQQATASGDSWAIATAAAGMGGGIASMDPVAAEPILRLASDAARITGNPFAIALAAKGQGNLLAGTGRLDEARVEFEEAVARFAEIGDIRLGLASQSDLAHALRRGGRLEEALAMYRDTISRWVGVGNRGAVANQLEGIAFIAIERGHAVHAARLLGAAQALREASSNSMAPNEEIEHAAWMRRLDALGDTEVVSTAGAAGRVTSMGDAVALALSGP